MEEHILFSKIQQGDAASFEWLYKKYHPRMYVFCYGLLHDSDKAKDIVQECFIAFWEHRTHIDAPEAISAYLFRIMKNLCVKQHSFLNVVSPFTLKKVPLPKLK